MRKLFRALFWTREELKFMQPWRWAPARKGFEIEESGDGTFLRVFEIKREIGPYTGKDRLAQVLEDGMLLTRNEK